LELFIDIAINVTLPIVAIAALGYVMQTRIKLDVASINRLLVTVIMPCFLVHFLASARQPVSEIWPVAYFTVVQFLFLIPVGWLASLAFGLPRAFGPLLAMATVYANVGNYGIPLVQLAFPSEFLLHQSVITALMTILMVTVGTWLLAPSEQQATFASRLAKAFETPIVPAVMLGLVLRGFEIRLPQAIGTPIELLGATFPPLALFAMGAQLATRTAGAVNIGRLSLILMLKLVVAPAVTWGLAIAMGMPEELSDLLVVAAATPIGILLALFCVEYAREPKFLSTAIMMSTVLSPFTVTAWVMLTRVY